MRKILKITMVFLFTFAIVGCGNQNNNAQRKVIEQYFDFLEDGNIEELEKLMVKSEDDQFGAMEFLRNIEHMIHAADMYGEGFQEKYEELLITMRENVIEEYKINDIKLEDGEATVSVSGNYVGLVNYSVYEIIDSSEVYEILMNIIEEMGEDLEFDDYIEALSEIIDEMTEDIFEEWEETLENLESKEFTAQFILVETEDRWVINSISSEQSINSFIN